MTTQQVAERFNQLAQQNQFEEILSELFSHDAKSIEPPHAPFPSVEGLDNIIAKGRDFHSQIEEMHSAYTNAPIIAGHFFACTMGMDVSLKGLGRHKFDEIAVYEVRNGKIISEQFFF